MGDAQITHWVKEVRGHGAVLQDYKNWELRSGVWDPKLTSACMGMGEQGTFWVTDVFAVFITCQNGANVTLCAINCQSITPPRKPLKHQVPARVFPPGRVSPDIFHGDAWRVLTELCRAANLGVQSVECGWVCGNLLYFSSHTKLCPLMGEFLNDRPLNMQFLKIWLTLTS
jgi:hypothetical protein